MLMDKFDFFHFLGPGNPQLFIFFLFNSFKEFFVWSETSFRLSWNKFPKISLTLPEIIPSVFVNM
jgi:hypothetical protein